MATDPLAALVDKETKVLKKQAEPIEIVASGVGEVRGTPATIGGITIEQAQDVERYINILIYGDPGIGKTVLSGSADEVEEMSPVLMVDVEGGTMSLTNTYPGVKVVRVKDWIEMQKVYDDLCSGKQPYKTVILDSLTEMQKFSMGTIMDNLIKKNPERDPDIPSQQEWGKNINQIRAMVRAFRDLPMNVIFTALANKDRDGSGRTLTRVSLPGKLSGEIPAFVDIVAYYFIKQVNGANKRMLLTSATATEIAKDRSGRLPQVIEEPDMNKLYGLMFKS